MMVPFLHSGHCNQHSPLRISLVLSTLNERQLVCQVGELGEPIFAFTRLKKRQQHHETWLSLMRR